MKSKVLVFDTSSVVRRSDRLVRILKVSEIHSFSHIVLFKTRDEEKTTDEEGEFAVDSLVSITKEIVSVDVLEGFGEGLGSELRESVFQTNISEKRG